MVEKDLSQLKLYDCYGNPIGTHFPARQCTKYHSIELDYRVLRVGPPFLFATLDNVVHKFTPASNHSSRSKLSSGSPALGCDHLLLSFHLPTHASRLCIPTVCNAHYYYVFSRIWPYSNVYKQH